MKKDLTGKRFGKLEVLTATDARQNGSVVWQCRCDCGNLCSKPTNELNAGLAVSCGCAWRQPAVKSGERFGRLVTLEPTEKRAAGSVVWKCLCDCGTIVEARATLLKNGHIKSCGCLKAEIDKKRPLENLTYQDGTCIEFLRSISVPTKASNTGIRGVVRREDGRYQATLTFRKQRYYLGRFTTLEEAAKARAAAEESVAGYLAECEKNKEVLETI
ncbi:MAG: hypothetical protein E7662_02290 [Ruminococcaceae bacterium]|nr:hypothetical protein [Oscillospiraceae bacterium]